MKVPCKDCPEKGCGEKHLTCPQFLAFRAEKEDEYKKKSLRVFYTPKERKRHKFKW